MNANLVLENGVTFRGESFGADGESTGEVVFNTSLTGYEEILTDPSYCGQIVAMTCPMIGNYGVNPADVESSRSHVSGFVVKEYSAYFSNFRAHESLDAWLKKYSIPGIQGIDTRMLTRIIRDRGAMRGIISTSDDDEQSLLRKVRQSPLMAGLDLTRNVTCREPYRWDEADTGPYAPPPHAVPGRRAAPFNVIVYDYGVKRNILRRLAAYGCGLTVVPSDLDARKVLAMAPDGIFFSNGPGDPGAVHYAIQNILELIGKLPIFGICLGHQLLALALGGRTFKLKFGHHGANHPVKNLLKGEVEITSQNHGFAVDPDSLDPSEIEITHVNLNDGTNEGFRHRRLPLFSVQYHPEASPGPHDSDYLFEQFVAMMAKFNKEHIPR